VPDVLHRDEERRDAPAWAALGALDLAVRDDPVRRVAQEISIAVSLAARSAAELAREDSPERRAVMDSNSVSVVPASPQQLWVGPELPALQP
jgi:hypothetical protein